MSTRSRLHSARSTTRPPVGRLHEKAVPRPLIASSARQRWPYLDALRFTDRPMVVLDRAAACEPLVLDTCSGPVSDPLAFGRALANSSGDTAGEW